MRVFINPRRSMQRVGFLKHLLWRAFQSTTNNMFTLGKNMVEVVSQKVNVTLTKQIQEYISTALTSTMYQDLRRVALKPLEEVPKDYKIPMEIQDVYLADSRLPSRRGKLVGDDWNRYTYLAIDLGLLRKGPYSVTARGHALLSLTPDEEKKALENAAIESDANITNPFILTLQQKLLLLFSFIESDGDVLRLLYAKLLTEKQTLKDKVIGNLFPDIYRMIAKESREKVRSGDDFVRIQRLLDTADKIEAIQKHPSPGGKNPREHATPVRLEPFVDFGLLAKPDPFFYRYTIIDSTIAFFSKLLESENIDDFLQNHYFDCANNSLTVGKQHVPEKNIIMPPVFKAYSMLKSPLGYAPILEVCLLAGIYSLNETQSYFEIGEALDCLKEMQKEKPKLIRFNIDRWGKLSFLKLVGDLEEIIAR